MIRKVGQLLEKLKLYGPLWFARHAILETYMLIWARLVQRSYSQRWEDLAVDKFLNKIKGFYIDVGANDPIRMNNTYRFYRKGWRGINIEPNVDCITRLRKTRKRDLNLNIGIGTGNKKMRFFIFSPDTISTFSRQEALEYQRMGFRIVGEIEVPTMKLSDVLNKYCKERIIDFMTIDTTEEYEFVALKSNDWKKFRPRVICIEAAGHDFYGSSKVANKKKIYRYLIRKGYKEYLNNGLNVIFVDNVVAK